MMVSMKFNDLEEVRVVAGGVVEVVTGAEEDFEVTAEVEAEVVLEQAPEVAVLRNPNYWTSQESMNTYASVLCDSILRQQDL